MSEAMGYVVGMIVGFFLGMLVLGFSNDGWRTDCVKRGVAEWVVSDNGTVTWKWKEPKP